MSERIRFRYPTLGDWFTPEALTKMIGQNTKVDGHLATITDVVRVRDLRDGDSLEFEVEVADSLRLTEKGEALFRGLVVSWEPPEVPS